MRKLRVFLASALLLAGLVVPVLTAPRGRAADDKEEAVTAQQLTKLYAESPAEFDKTYKGKAVTVEGVVSATGARGFVPAGQAPGKSYLMIQGYSKAGAPVPYGVRCEESGPDFEGIHTGHKVRIRGTVQGHSPTSVAAELRDCKVVKVFADDYPPSKAVREEVKKLQGKWKVVGGEASGTKLGPGQAGFDAIHVEGYGVELHRGKQVLPFGLSLDPDKTPKTIDLIGERATLPCIYSLEGGQLRLALPAGRPKEGKFQRPETLDTAKSNALVLIAERQK
jgi:uncharacterized protein (TIGR03067 family)